MPDDAITKGKALLEQAKEERDDLIDRVNAFNRKYPPASVVLGVTLIEGQGATYAYGGPPGPRQNMGHILARIAEDEQIASLRGRSSPIQVAHQMPGKPS